MARVQGRVDELPSPRPRKTLPQRALRVLLLERNGEILLERRPPVGIWGGLLSLPELPLDADVQATVKTRFGASVAPGAQLPPIAHGFTHFALTLHPQWMTVRRWAPRAESPGLIWMTLADARHAALPAPIHKLLRSLER